MKRKLLILAAALVIAVSAVGCGKDEDKTDAEGSQQTEQNTNDGSASDTSDEDFTKITSEEIDAMADNEFYAANASGVEITDIYVAVTGAGDWGENLLSSPIADGTKVKLSLDNPDFEASYDICVVDANSNTTEYYNFDMKSTVQVTFYANAQCDVSTI